MSPSVSNQFAAIGPEKTKTEKSLNRQVAQNTCIELLDPTVSVLKDVFAKEDHHMSMCHYILRCPFGVKIN